MDLLTAVMHEIGHVLGYDHEDQGLMQDELAPGTRWTLGELDSIWDADFDFGV